MNVSAGDLAYIVKAVPHHADCIGRIVRVVSLSTTTAWGALWLIEFVGPVPASIKDFRPGDLVFAYDSHLRRIAGPSVDSKVDEKIEEPA